MTELPDSVVGNAFNTSQVWDVLEYLTDIGGRMAGHESEKQGAKFLAEELSSAGGTSATVSEFPIYAWWRDCSAITINGESNRKYDNPHEISALAGSPSGTTEGKLVDLGWGQPEVIKSTDISKSIVLVSSKTPDDYGRWVHRYEKYGLAVEEGASGFLFYNELPGCLPLAGNIGDDGPGPIPAVSLSREVGYYLLRKSRQSVLDVEVCVNAKSEQSTSQNVEVTIGPDSHEEVLLTAHVDSHDIAEGATDNAVGCAIVTEACRILTQIEDKLNTKVRFVIFGSEEIGLCGSYNWVNNNDTDRVKCIVNVDGNGQWNNVTAYTHGFESLYRTVSEVSDSSSVDVDVTNDYLPFSDHWPFVQNGVPGIMIRSESEQGRGWGHTHADTLDKLEKEPLQKLSLYISSLIYKVASESNPITHASPSDVRDELIERGHSDGLQAAGDWPFDKDT